MDEKGYKFGVGVLVVASLVIAVILIMFFGAAPNLFADRYLVTIRFDAAPGISKDTPVRKNGVQIGRVKDFKLLTSAEGVDITLELDRKYEILAKYQPRIDTGSLITGDAVVEFVPPSNESLVSRFDGLAGSPQNGMLEPNELALSELPLEGGNYYKGGSVAPDPLEALLNMQESVSSTLGAIQGASDSIEEAGDQVKLLATNLNSFVGEGDGAINDLATEARATIVNFNRTLKSIESVFGDERLGATIDTVSVELPLIVAEAKQVMRQANDTLAAFEEVGVITGNAMQNVTGEVENIAKDIRNVTQPLGEQGDELVGEARQTLRNIGLLAQDLRTVSMTVNQFAQRVNDGQGTLAKLIEDEQLYYSLINTLQNIEQLTRRLQPIVDDARVFSDKVARDPAALIDIKGAITGRPRGGMKR